MNGISDIYSFDSEINRKINENIDRISTKYDISNFDMEIFYSKALSDIHVFSSLDYCVVKIAKIR